jgi:hypothetical protein
MRIDPASFEALRERVAALDTPDLRERYRRGDFVRAHLVRDLDTRYRWDLFFACRGYEVLVDSADPAAAHIATALRRIVAPLGGAA